MAAALNVMKCATVRRLVAYRFNAKLVGRLWSNNSASDDDESRNASSEGAATSQLDLAKPGRARLRQATVKGKSQPEARHRPDEQGLDKELITAVSAVADAIGKDSQKLRSDLLKKLQEQRNRSYDGQKVEDKSNVSSLLSGMKLEKVSTGVSKESVHAGRTRRQGSGQNYPERFGSAINDMKHHRKSKDSVDLCLFEGPSLGIFKKATASKGDEFAARKCLFDIIDEEEREKLMMMPPTNAFEEMIQWTKEGKLWKFPIDNEQGMDEEARVGFHEHIFLDQLLDEFPKKGPIRHFMELIIVGLSKNPFFTAQEKHEHIAWYAKYFKDKYHLIDSDMPLSLDNAQQLDSSSSASSRD